MLFLDLSNVQVSCLSFLMELLWSCICHPSLEELVLDGTKIGERDEWKPSGLALCLQLSVLYSVFELSYFVISTDLVLSRVF